MDQCISASAFVHTIAHNSTANTELLKKLVLCYLSNYALQTGIELSMTFFFFFPMNSLQTEFERKYRGKK